MKDYITVNAHIERLIYSLRTPGAEWSQGSATQLPNGDWKLEVSPDVRAKLESLRFPGESDSDLLLRIITIRSGSVN